MGRLLTPEEKTGWAATPSQSRRSNHSSRYLHENSRFGKSDRLLANYLRWLQLENERLKGGEIGRGFWQDACAAYVEFRAGGCPRARWLAWLGVQLCCEWLSEAETGGAA